MSKRREDMINLELYKVFYTVARCGSLTKASEELYISQPAVSHAVKQLEAQLGTPLFIRSQKGMELTAQGGKVIIDDVERAIKLFASVEDKLAERRGSPAGVLRIGASETIFRYILSEKIVEYHTLYPQVKIELIEDKTPGILDCLKSDRCDIGFLNLPVPEDDSIRLTESVLVLDDIFIAGKENEALKGRDLTVWDLQKYPLLLLGQTTVARASVEHYAESMGAALRPTIEVDSWEFMKQLVERGMGIGCIPRQYVQKQLKEGTLFALNVFPPLPSRSVGMAVLKSADSPFALRLFMKMFEK